MAGLARAVGRRFTILIPSTCDKTASAGTETSGAFEDMEEPQNLEIGNNFIARVGEIHVPIHGAAPQGIVGQRMGDQPLPRVRLE